MKFKMYKDANGEWRWRLLASNKKVLADSGEGYKNQAHCKKIIKRIVSRIQTAPIGSWEAELEKELG